MYDIACTLTVLLLQSTYKYNTDWHNMLVPQYTADLQYAIISVRTVAVRTLLMCAQQPQHTITVRTATTATVTMRTATGC